MMRIALLGNQNSGKSTLFNALTGARQHVGNYPGVTVERRVAPLASDSRMIIEDLPGTYSLRPSSAEEDVTRRALIDFPPDVIVNVLDITSAARGLYLTLSALRLGIPAVVALTMCDTARRAGNFPDVRALAQELSVPVVELDAARGVGTSELIRECMSARKPCAGAAHETSPDALYRRIDAICLRCRLAPTPRRATETADRLLAGRLWGIPIFFAVMASVFFITFEGPGRMLSDMFSASLDALIDAAGAWLRSAGASDMCRSFICDGVLRGVASVLGFLPSILVLFFLLSLLEDSGYIARAAFLFDAPLFRLGLSGRAVVPLLIGFGCSVPALLSARTLSSERERGRVSLLIPFMSCSAKLPVYSVIVSALFEENRALIITALYTLGIFFAIIYAVFLKSGESQDAELFFLELPPYRVPRLRDTCALMWERAYGFVKKAFGIILLASVALWLVSHFGVSGAAVAPEESLLFEICRAAAPIFSPLGFSDWRFVAALVAGFGAKEAVVSTLAVLMPFPLSSSLGALLSPPAALSFLTFVLLYMPCAATCATLRRERKSGVSAAGAMALQTLIAYAAAGIVFAIAVQLM